MIGVFPRRGRGFQSLPSLSKLWIAGSLHREGRRSPKDDPKSPESGVFASGFEQDGKTGERNFPFPPRREAGFPRRGHRRAGFSTGSPAGLAGERNFPREKPEKVWIAEPFTERTTKPGERDSPESGIPSPENGIPRSPGSGIFYVRVAGAEFSPSALRKLIPPRRSDSPAGVTGERDFRPGPSLGSLCGSQGAGFSLVWGRGFRLFLSLSKKLWIAGSLHREGRRSPGSGIRPPGSP